MTDTTPSKSVNGFNVGGVSAGFKADGSLDFAVILSDRPAVTAAVFTTNQVKAAPVLYDMSVLEKGRDHIRAVVVNTRCANACTGEEGLANAAESARLAAEKFGIPQDSVLVMSTGVIGTQLPMEKIANGLDIIAPTLAGDDAAWDKASYGIMTTDTKQKIHSIKGKLSNGREFTITGIAKGAGMIAPNMATMLGFMVTDAGLTAEQADRLLHRAVNLSFNRIVVDGDTSTNDSVFLLSNGASGTTIESKADEEYFFVALKSVCTALAQAVVRDGEGATKFITIRVSGAADEASAKQIANTIAISPLVKTAFYGGDANWGRLVMAAGRAGIPLDQTKLNLFFIDYETNSNFELLRGGLPTRYDEAKANELVKRDEIGVLLELGLGSGEAIIWTCDLSHDYVSINGHYRS